MNEINPQEANEVNKRDFQAGRESAVSPRASATLPHLFKPRTADPRRAGRSRCGASPGKITMANGRHLAAGLMVARRAS